MPTETTPASSAVVDSFGSFRAAREGSAPPKEPSRPPADKPAEVNAQSADPAEGSQPSPGSDPDSSQVSKVDKRKADIQKDIDAQVARREAARREADAEEARLKALKGGTSTEVPHGTPPGDPAKPAAAPASVADGTDPSDPEPKRPVQAEWKGTWQEWEDALEKWRTDRAAWAARKEWRKLDQERTAKEAETKAQTEWQRDRESFEKTARTWAKDNNAPDFDDLYQEILKRPVLSAETTSVAVYGGEAGARLLYELMTHPDQLEEIENMPRRIDRLNALYELKYKLATPASEPAQEKPRSNAPPARTPLSGTGGGGSSNEPKSYNQFKQKRFA